MSVIKNQALTLLAALAVASAACSGDKGAPGTNGSDGTNGTDGTNGSGGIDGASTGLKISVTSVSTDPAAPISVRFTLTDDRGWPVDLKGVYSVNTAMPLRFSLAYVSQDAKGNVLPYTVLTNNAHAGSTTFNPSWFAAPAPGVAADGTSAFGTLVENGTGAGDYTYTFPSEDATLAKAVKYDATKLSSTHTLWIAATRQCNLAYAYDTGSFYSVNQEYDFIPAGSGTPLKREIVLTSNCSKCHDSFKGDTIDPNDPKKAITGRQTFHGGNMVEGPFCNVCHNPARASAKTNSDGATPAAASAIHVHRIHNGKNLQAASVFHGIDEVTYPQDLRHCDACHGGAAQGAQSKTHPTRAACGSCHDYVDFTGSLAVAQCTDPVTTDAAGKPVPCFHLAGTGVTQNDDQCASCHSPSGADFIGDRHVAVAPPDPTNSLLVAGGNTHTNQMYVAAAGQIPPGAIQLKYVVSSATAVADAAGVLRPQITFKFQQSTDGTNFTDVVFNAFGSGKSELMDNFVGSPSAYFAFAVGQDAIAAPADFNASASGYIKNIWNGTATGTMTGPDATGFYTITLTGAVIPATAKMLTGGIGYTYGTTSTQPMTQTNVPGYPYNWDPYSNTAVAGMGGLLVPVHDEWVVAKGNDGSGKPWVGRRPIVENARCLTCHASLGANPTFHAGQRNDGPTCAFCHNANQNNGGWSGNAKSFIHAIHGARQRTNNFTWHAESATAGFFEVTFPGPVKNCEACHVKGGYDFSTSAALTALPNMLWSTNAANSVTVPTFGSAGGPASYNLSPYVSTTAAYGLPFSTSSFKDAAGAVVKACSTGSPCQAEATTLVSSPITAACVACHDSAVDVAHITQTGGGSFYAARAGVGQLPATVEQCLLCHGADSIAPIAQVHK